MFENLGFFEISVFEIRDFQTSVFSIFAMGEYRKHGFINPCFRYSENTDVENLGFLKSQFSIFTRHMFENLGFLKSKFSIFTTGEYRKHGFIKVGEKNRQYPRYPRHRVFDLAGSMAMADQISSAIVKAQYIQFSSLSDAICDCLKQFCSNFFDIFNAKFGDEPPQKRARIDIHSDDSSIGREPHRQRSSSCTVAKSGLYQ